MFLGVEYCVCSVCVDLCIFFNDGVVCMIFVGLYVLCYVVFALWFHVFSLLFVVCGVICWV